MVINDIIVNEYFKHKNNMNAAYAVFKKNPSMTNASRHAEATSTFKNFCTDTLATLVGDVPADASEKDLEILTHFEDYRSCKQCNSDLLYKVADDRFIASGEFLENFPGWCHTCLAEHCNNTDCSLCTVSKDTENCSFKGLKNIYIQSDK